MKVVGGEHNERSVVKRHDAAGSVKRQTSPLLRGALEEVSSGARGGAALRNRPGNPSCCQREPDPDDIRLCDRAA